MKIKVFRAANISQALSMIEAIEVVKNAFVQLSSKELGSNGSGFPYQVKIITALWIMTKSSIFLGSHLYS
jgi:hypothetical protein